MPANERSHDDHPVKTVRQRRRRLLTHAVVFAGAGLLAMTLGSTATSAAPTVQDGRFLQGGSVDVDYSCTGGDETTNGLLTTFGLNPFPMPVSITSASVEPAPSPGESFETEFTWSAALDPNIVDFAVGLGVTTFTISNGVNPVQATTGATGSAPGTGAAGNAVIDLTDTVADGYTSGPYTGTFSRTAEVDAPIVFTPQAISSTVTTNSGTALSIVCTPGAGAITVLDETGVAPSTTTTTLGTIDPPTTVAPPTTTDVGAGGELPRTGTSSSLLMALLAVGLIDIGYLTWSAGRPARRRTSSAV